MSNFANNLSLLREAMNNCEQTKGLTVYQHGVSVSNFFEDLRGHIMNGEALSNTWKLPSWAKNKKLWDKLLPVDEVIEYLTYHDCGKPYCRIVDEEGKAHFPNHAEVSGDIWRSIGGKEPIALLMSMDMDIHTIKASEMEEFSQRIQACTLLIAGLSEIHSNASMFGGIDSVSFKSKYKQIDRRGKALIKLLNIEE